MNNEDNCKHDIVYFIESYYDPMKENHYFVGICKECNFDISNKLTDYQHTDQHTYVGLLKNNVMDRRLCYEYKRVKE